MKAIVSSNSISSMMPDGTRNLHLVSGTLFCIASGGHAIKSIPVESQKGESITDLNRKQIKTIRDVLSSMEEQPITIQIYDGKFSIVSEILF